MVFMVYLEKKIQGIYIVHTSLLMKPRKFYPMEILLYTV